MSGLDLCNFNRYLSLVGQLYGQHKHLLYLRLISNEIKDLYINVSVRSMQSEKFNQRISNIFFIIIYFI